MSLYMQECSSCAVPVETGSSMSSMWQTTTVISRPLMTTLPPSRPLGSQVSPQGLVTTSTVLHSLSLIAKNDLQLLSCGADKSIMFRTLVKVSWIICHVHCPHSSLVTLVTHSLYTSHSLHPCHTPHTVTKSRVPQNISHCL